MPQYWYNRRVCYNLEGLSDEEREFQMSIIADRKPYFMRYIYPSLMKQYNTYINNTKKKCLREFRIGIDELLAKPQSELTEDEATFVYYYRAKMPVGMHNCVMNRICRRFEEEFDGFQAQCSEDEAFDPELYKSGEEYSPAQRRSVEAVMEEYVRRASDFSQYAHRNRVPEIERTAMRDIMRDSFRRMCYEVCQNERQLCDILVDVCYQKEGTKQMVWDVCPSQIVSNLLEKNGWVMRFPVESPDGDITYRGQHFAMKEKYVRPEEVEDVYCSEREGVCGEGYFRMYAGDEAD